MEVRFGITIVISRDVARVRHMRLIPRLILLEPHPPFNNILVAMIVPTIKPHPLN